MNSGRWEQIETIFHAAMEIDAAERHEYLTRTCAGQDNLIVEVESLISALDGADFMEEPAFELGLDIIGRNGDEDLSGREIGSFKVLRKLGAGGMGEVYLADDLTLDRQVALKFLSGALTDDAPAKRQLTKEARAVAVLDHPNICPVYDIKETDKHHFIVMQYCRGATLDNFVKNESPDVKTILNIARQIVGAIAEAHSHGIIHRDIKPGNLIVTPNGQVKVLDFGLAKVVRKKQNAEIFGENKQASRHGMIVGTISYMSPEQMRGEKLDFRSDVFSIGIVLYEMLGERNPFHQESQADSIASILRHEPAPLKNFRPEVPPAVSDAVEKCLSKDREKRFQSAVELLVELENISENTDINRGSFGFSAFANYAAPIFLLLLIVGIGFFLYLRPATKIPTLAVLPIINESGMSKGDYLGVGLTDDLTGRLDRVSNLKIKAATLVAKYKDQPADPQTVNNEIKTDTILQGRIIRRGDNALQLDVNLIETTKGSRLWGDKFILEDDQLIAVQEKISKAVVARLVAPLSDQEERKLKHAQTNDPEALRLYYLGRYFWSKRIEKVNLEKAFVNFHAATDRDPSFAQAWAGLADCYIIYSNPGYDNVKQPTDTIRSARAAARQALQFDSESSEAYVSLAMINLLYDWNWQDAEVYFQKAIALDADNAAARFGYSNLLIITNRFDQAADEGEKVKELNPFSPNSDLNSARIYYYRKNFNEALRILSELSKQNPNNEKISYSLGLCYLAMNRTTEATAIFEKLYAGEASAKLLVAGALGYTYGKTGKPDEARRILAELEAVSKNKFISHQEFALIYFGLDNHAKAFENLSAACNEKFPSFPYLVIDPLLEEFHSDPRYAQIRSCANL